MKVKYKFFVLFTMIILVSCNQSKIKNLESKIDALELELEETNDKLFILEVYTTELSDEIEDLKHEIDAFSHKGWRTNIRDINNEMSDVERALDNLRYEF